MKPFARPLLFTAALVAALRGGLNAQQIVPAQTSLSFSAQPGASSQPVTLAVTSSGAALVLNATVNTFGTGNWLVVSPNISGTPATFVVYANASGLAAGVYSGEVLFSAVGAINSPVAVPVTFTVGSSTGGTLSVSPPSLSFTGQVGGLVPSPKTLGLVTTPAGIGFATSVSTENGINWLQVLPVTGVAPAPVTVSVNPAGLPPGVFNGTIVLTPANGPAVSVPVTLTMAPGSVLSVSAAGLQFYYQVGNFFPGSQTFDVGTSAGLPLTFATSASTNDGRSWLTASPTFGTTPQSVTVSVAPSGLGPGIYTGKVNVSAPSAANGNIDVPVTLTVSNNPLLTVGAFPARFVYQAGGSLPPSQSIVIGSSSGSLDYTTTINTSGGSGWLSASPASGKTPQSLTIAVSPTNLQPGTYSGTITVSAPAASNSPLSIPVTLTVGDNSALTSTIQAVNLNYQIGGSNQVLSQTLTVGATGQSVAVSATATTSTCGANWLRVFPDSFTTPAAVTIALETIGFTIPAECSGFVTFTPIAGGQSLQIPVTLKVANTALFNVTPLSLSFSAPFDGSPTTPQTISLSTTDNSAASFTIAGSTSGGGNWLQVSAVSGTTPASIGVRADPNNLSVGTYTGTLLISSPAIANVQAIPITFRVTSTIAAAASPVALSFTQVVGGSVPAARQVSLTTTGGATSFVVTTSTSNSVGWLSATPNTGNTPDVITVGVNGAGLPPGSYSGSVIVTLPAAANSPLIIPITFNVAPARAISADPVSVSFIYRAGDVAPAAQQVRVTSAGDPVSVSATSVIANGTGWLSVSPASATTPATFNVTVAPAGLSTGSYSGTITLTAPGSPGSPITIPVQLDVIGAPAPSITDVTNAASGQRGAIAPGEIVTIKGFILGPPEGAGLRLTPSGNLATVVAGTRVLFGAFEAPILYTSAGQVNVVAPYEIATASTIPVVVEYQGVRSPAVTYQVAATAPGVFTTTQTGRGQGAILNQDNSYNSAAAPAEEGSVVQVFATGEGVTRPPSQTGSVTNELHVPVAGVTATVGGFEAEVTFAGSAPGAVAGLFQVNVRIPRNVPSGNVPLVLTVGRVSSQTAVTVSVR